MTYEGKVVLNYKLTKKLGEGGFGAVYLAEQVDLGRRAAIKILHHQFATQPAVVERFFREAKAVCQIGHRAIIAIENFGRLPETDEPFYLMEFFSGGSVTQIASERWLTSEQLIAIFDPVADALGAAHAKGIIHRDLKPDNIMVRIANDVVADVRLLDFGIAKLLDGESHSMTGSAMGTPSYMPPEQALDAKNVDVRADVYSFGATIYAAVCGRPPFDGSSVAAILLAVQQQTAMWLHQYRADVTPELDAAIRRCLAKARDHRPPSIADAWSAIRGELARAHLSSAPQRAQRDPTQAVMTPVPMRAATPLPFADGPAPPVGVPQVTPIAPSVMTPAPGTVKAIDVAPATTPEIRRKSKTPIVLGVLGLVGVFGIVVAVVAAMSGSKTEHIGSGSGVGSSDSSGSGAGTGSTAVSAATPDAAPPDTADPPVSDAAATTVPTRLTRDEAIEPVSRAMRDLLPACGAKPGAKTIRVTYHISIDAAGKVTFAEIDGGSPTSTIAVCVKSAIKAAPPPVRPSMTGVGFTVVLDVPADKPDPKPDPKPPDPKPPDPKPPDPKPPGGNCAEGSFAAAKATSPEEVDAMLARLNQCRDKVGIVPYMRLKDALVQRKLSL